MNQKTVMTCIGTRPEAIKMAPVIRCLEATGWANTVTVATGQHRELLDQALDVFDLQVEFDLDLMREEQDPIRLASRVLDGLGSVFQRVEPDFVLAQGDTTTLLATTIASYYSRIPFGHVEAGLRTFDPLSPFPEEGNRVVAAQLATIHFAPTQQARRNLLRENIPRDRIHVVGNTIVDTLYSVAERAENVGPELPSGRRLLVVTVHRRESFGLPVQAICRALRAIVHRFLDVEILWPLHPNPAVADPVRESMKDVDRVRLVPALPYVDFIGAMKKAFLVLTDSGGVQEEAPVLGVPVLVLRERTERLEAIDAGVARLVGTSAPEIERQTALLLDNPSLHRRMAIRCSPFGDGNAAPRIVASLQKALARH